MSQTDNENNNTGRFQGLAAKLNRHRLRAPPQHALEHRIIQVLCAAVGRGVGRTQSAATQWLRPRLARPASTLVRRRDWRREVAGRRAHALLPQSVRLAAQDA